MKHTPEIRLADIPSEANRDKHINLIALENNEADSSDLLATGKLAATNNEYNKNALLQAGKKKAIFTRTSLLGLSAMTLLFCGFIYVLLLKAVALLLTMA